MRGLFIASGLVALATTSQATMFMETEFGSGWDFFTTVANGQSATQVSDGGNTGGANDPFWEVTTNTNATVESATTNAAWTVDPSNGAIISIDFSVDIRNINSFGEGHAFGIAAIQDGKYYSVDLGITGSSNFDWFNEEHNGLVESDFSLFSGASDTLDFSASGTEITFGLYTANTGGNTIKVGYDNLEIDVEAVPEPATLAVLAAGAVALRRKRKS